MPWDTLIPQKCITFVGTPVDKEIASLVKPIFNVDLRIKVGTYIIFIEHFKLFKPVKSNDKYVKDVIVTKFKIQRRKIIQKK